MLRGPHFLWVSLLGLGLGLTSSGVLANSPRAEFLVSVTVVRHCSVALPKSLDAPLARGTLAMNCSSNTGYSVYLGTDTALNGVGNGASQGIPLYAYTQAVRQEAFNASTLRVTVVY